MGFAVASAAAAAVPGQAEAQGRRVRSDQEILEQLERDWDDAFRRKDIAFIDSILADDFVATIEAIDPQRLTLEEAIGSIVDRGVGADQARVHTQRGGVAVEARRLEFLRLQLDVALGCCGVHR